MFYLKEDAEVRVFVGNQDANTAKKNSLVYPIYTKWVQFHPLTWVSGIALRVAVYGFGDGMVTYMYLFKLFSFREC